MKPTRKTRRGLSLVEVVAASTIMATLMASSVVVLRSSYAAWQAHESDLEQAEVANAIVRHVNRIVRQAEGVADVTPPTDDAGSLTLIMPDGSQRIWTRVASTGRVLFGTSEANGLLADNVDFLRFVALERDGVTLASAPRFAQLIRCEVGVTMPFSGGTQRTVSCTGWIRSWGDTP